jgi:hypothetical protein
VLGQLRGLRFDAPPGRELRVVSFELAHVRGEVLDRLETRGQLAHELGRRDQPAQLSLQVGRVGRLEQPAVDAVAHALGQRTDAAGEHRPAGRERLADHEGLVFDPDRGHDHQVELAQDGSQIGARVRTAPARAAGLRQLDEARAVACIA